MLLKQLNPKPWAWPRQLGTAGSLLTMLMFVLVSVVAANAHWNMETARLVAGLVLARGLAKIVGVGAANWGSGLSWRQALYAGSAMSPMSSVALLLVSQFASSSPALPLLARIALPAILLMEVLGSILATVAVHRTGESSRSWGPDSSLTTPGELRG
jgi:Kef-type K+ transport system membrane component KefB